MTDNIHEFDPDLMDEREPEDDPAFRDFDGELGGPGVEAPPVEAPEPTAITVQQSQAMTLQSLVLANPENASKMIEAWDKALTTLERVAILATQPSNWVLFKGRDGQDPIGIYGRDAAAKIRKRCGISVYNWRPKGADGAPRAEISSVRAMKTFYEDNKRVSREVEAMQAAIWADGVCGMTGEKAQGIRGIRNSAEDFVGRGTQADLEQAAITSCLTKITMQLSGIGKTPLSILAVTFGMTPEEFEAKAQKGAGYGTSKDREEGQAAPLERAAAFWAHLVASFPGGAEFAPGEVLREMSKFTDKDGNERAAKTEAECKRLSAKWLDSTIKKFNQGFPGKRFTQ